MAKLVGYEVIARKPVCVDFPDGRVVSYKPGMRFTAHATNTSVRRLVSIRELRELGSFETMPVTPAYLGEPKDVRSILEAKQKLNELKRQAEVRRARESKITSPKDMEPVDLSAINRPRRIKPKAPESKKG